MRRRIIRLATAVTLVAVLLFGLPLAIGLTGYFISDQHRRLHELAAAIAVAVSGDQGLRQLPAQANTDPAKQIAVFDPAGTKLSGDAPPAAAALVGKALSGVSADGTLAGRYTVAVPVTDGNSVVGVVLASEPDNPITTTVAITWAAMLALAGIAITVSWLLGRRQAAVLTRPLQALAEVAERLGEGNFAVRTAPTGIAEIDSVNRSIDRTAARLGQLVERERTYTADASHQLRTPLTGLRLQLEAALENTASDPRAAIRDALLTTDRLEKTVTDLLALARDTPSPAAPLDIARVMIGVRERWHGPLAAKGRALTLKMDHVRTPVAASAAAVDQILDVLLDNASRHGHGDVTVTAREVVDGWAVDVSNNGPVVTIAPSELFERRSTTSVGHGIGLPLARTLAEAEAGRLSLTASSPTFTLLLPTSGAPIDRPPDA